MMIPNNVLQSLYQSEMGC